MTTRDPQTPQRSRSSLWRVGFSSTARGHRFLQAHPTLWPHLWRPLIANTVLSTLIFLLWGVTWWYASQWMTQWIGHLAETWAPSWLTFLLQILATLLLGIAAGAAALLVWRVAQGVLLSVIYANLSLQVESRLGVDISKLQGAGWSQAVIDTAVQVGLLIGLQILALGLNGIPLIGSVTATAVNLIGTTSLLGLDLLALPMAARGDSRTNQLRTGYRHLWLASGLGTSVLLWQAIPLLGGWGTTLALIGATELYHLEIATNAERNPSGQPQLDRPSLLNDPIDPA